MPALVEDDPAKLYDDIKSQLREFRTALKRSGPSDAQVEIIKTSLRHRIQALILQHPCSTQAQAAESLLWLDISYALINAYRQLLSTANKSDPSSVGRPRKLVDRFRSFLSSEESFWSGLALAIVRAFGLVEAKPALVTLQITSPDPSNPLADVSIQSILSPEEGDEDRPKTPPKSINDVEDHQTKLLSVHKVLVCLGDLARYREQFNERGGRPKAGQLNHSADWKPRNGRGGKKAPKVVAPHDRDFSRAADCYHQARMLLPDYGNPSNQLAVLALSEGDLFSSVYYCYRALCVKHRFPSAEENLRVSLRKVTEIYKLEPNQTPGPSPLEKFKTTVLLGHALWTIKPRSSLLEKQSAKITSLLKTVVKNRALPSDVIVKSLVMALGSLWFLRVFAQPLSTNSQTTATQESATPDSSSSKLSPKEAAPYVLAHLLDFISVLLAVAIKEVDDLKKDNTSSSRKARSSPKSAPPLPLAEKISAVLRRMLPALRIASKWLTANINYIAQLRQSDNTPEVTVKIIERFWSTYATFATVILDNFSVTQLPKLHVPLEEDVELMGFAPMKQRMSQTKPLDNAHGAKLAAEGETDGLAGVHPNEEHLMRVADIIMDAQTLAESKTCIHLIGARFEPLLFETVTAPLPVVNIGEHSKPTGPQPQAGVTQPLTSKAPELDDVRPNVKRGPRAGISAVALVLPLVEDDDDDYEQEFEEERILLPIRRSEASLRRQTGMAQGRVANWIPSSPSTALLPPSHAVETNFDALPNVNKKHAPITGMPPVTAEDLLAQALGTFKPMSPKHTELQPTTSNTRRHSASSHLKNTFYQPHVDHPSSPVLENQPLLLGDPGSVWSPSAPLAQTDRVQDLASGGRRQRATSNFSPTYSQSQSQQSVSHHLWGRPHDIFGAPGRGMSGSRSGLSYNLSDRGGGSDVLPTSPKAYEQSSSPSFNPAPGSAPFAYESDLRSNQASEPLQDVLRRNVGYRGLPLGLNPALPSDLDDVSSSPRTQLGFSSFTTENLSSIAYVGGEEPARRWGAWG